MAKSVIINGVTYPGVPSVEIPESGGGTASFYELSGADATDGDVRAGVKFGGAGGIGTGTMQEIADATQYISDKDQQITIAAGIHSGSGKVALDAAEKAKLISGNIKYGTTLFGVQGGSMIRDTTIASGAAGAAQIANGYKAWVNGELKEGTLSAVTVSQDSGTHVLTIQ